MTPSELRVGHPLVTVSNKLESLDLCTWLDDLRKETCHWVNLSIIWVSKCGDYDLRTEGWHSKGATGTPFGCQKSLFDFPWKVKLINIQVLTSQRTSREAQNEITETFSRIQKPEQSRLEVSGVKVLGTSILK